MKAANSKAFICKLRDDTTHSKGLIKWPGLAWFVGQAVCAEVTVIPYYMSQASLELPFLYRDWKQHAWAVCYPLSCFLLFSFVGLPGKGDYLENFYLGSQHHNTGILANRPGSAVM